MADVAGVAVKAESSLLSTPKVESTPILVETTANEVIQPGSDLRLFALIVTIDSYKNENIPDLSGCVNDGKDFQYFLTDALRVPPSRILSLSNQDATRSAILNAFMDHLIQNDNIRKGDAIVFFYAGHGSRVEAPTNWLADGNMIETIVPHDEGPSDVEGEVIYGIPDRTFDGLMRQLAHEKGDNITAIFDSCHSGGMSRGPLDMIPRAVPPNVSPSPVPPALDENIWRWGLSTRSASTMAPTGFLYKAMQSHVLMAACRPDEQALEASRVPEPHGAFTLNLLKTLRSQNLAELTYARLIELVQLRHQHPQCEGINKDRVLFNATKLLDRSRSFRVTKQKLDGALSIQAGSIHGVVEGTEFVVETSYGTSIDTVQNVVFTATHVEALQSILVCKPPATLPEALRDFRVVVSKWNSSTMKARFHYPVGSHCSVVGPNDYSDVAVHLGTGIGWQLERCDPLVARHASRVLNIPRGDVSETLDAVARFNFYLYRHHPQAPFKRELAIELRKLEVVPGSGLRPLLQPIGDNYFSSLAEKVVCAQDSSFNVDSVQEAIITDMEPYYGLTLVNDTEHDLFPYVFYFDPNDYSVQSWYLPHSPSMTPPLLQKGRLAIGYGASGTDSLRFSLPSGSKVDTGFLKVFVSTSYADMRSVPQPSVLDRSSRSSQQNRKDPAFTDTWDEFICVLTCKASSP
ncbi:caspase domain-containing protein [Fomitopsis serialis]|uniref:caspase domain-containing protein n=1 Tax=Fomitopsis serialis TaxID=139415 RepID=UPI002008D224|nr:caspase domain-containing protein [Neoantrodia serialis]KAH9923545.1 caspase domain-containing protein [Neoantrodia serialis]